MAPRLRPLTRLALAATLGLLPALASSQPLAVRSLEISPTIRDYKPGHVAVLSATSLLIPSTTPTPVDRDCGVTLLIEDLDREPKVTPLATPSADPCRRTVRLSPTRVLLLVDERIYLLDDLGGSNRVSSLEIGDPFTAGFGAHGAVRLDDDTAVVIAGTVWNERRVFVLADLGGAVRITETAQFPKADGLIPLGPRTFLLTEARNPYTAWYLTLQEDGSLVGPALELRAAVGVPVALSPTSFLFAFDEVPATYGDPDVNLGEDDSVSLFTGLGGEIERSDLATPFFASLREFYRGPGLTRLSATRAILPSPGPDWALGNDDDRVLVLDDLGGTNEVLAVSTPGLASIAPQRLLADRALLGLGFPAPSAVAALLDIGGSNTLGPSSGPLPLHTWDRSDLLALPPDGALFADSYTYSGGTTPDDDGAEWVSGLATSPVMERIPVRGLGAPYSYLTPLGNGRVFKTDWLEPLWYPDGPHHLHVIEGLGGLTLEVEQIALRFNQEYGASLRATAHLFLPEPTDFASSDLTVRIGNAWQTIPAAEIQATATGYLYEDPRGRRGFLRRLEYDAAAERLTLKGRGFGTRAASTRPDNLVLSLEGLFFYAAQSLDGTKRGDRIVYRR